MRPLSEFLAELDARGVQEFGWLRWRLWRLVGKARISWWFFWNGHKPLSVSQEAFDAFTPEDIAETQAAIAMEARQGRNRETGSDPKDDSAGPKDIAQ